MRIRVSNREKAREGAGAIELLLESKRQTARARQQEPESKRQRARGRVCKTWGRRTYRERRHM